MNQETILFVSTTEEMAQQLIALLEGGSFQLRWTMTDNALNEIAREMPALVIMIHDEESGLDTIRSLRRESAVPLFYIVEERNPLFIRDAFRLGATDILLFPDEASQLEERVAKAIERAKLGSALLMQEGNVSKSGGGRRSKVISFYSGKGGSGKSLLAATLAQTLRLDERADVILIDFNLQYGGVEGYLGIEGGRSFIELKPVLQELNELQIKSAVSRLPGSGLEVFISPKEISSEHRWNEHDVRLFFRALRAYYEVILIDTPTEIDDLSYAVLRQSDLIFYILNPELPALHAFRRSQLYFEQLGIDTKDKLQILINRASPSSTVKASDLTRLLPFPVVAAIREDVNRVRERLRRNIPLRLHHERPKNAVAADIRRLARKMHGVDIVSEPESERPSPLNRFQSLFRKRAIEVGQPETEQAVKNALMDKEI